MGQKILVGSSHSKAEEFETCLAKLEDSADTIVELLVDLLTNDNDGSPNILRDYIEGKNSDASSLLETSKCTWYQRD